MLAKGSFLSIFLRLGGWRQVVSVDVARSARHRGKSCEFRERVKSACLGIGLAAETNVGFSISCDLRCLGSVALYIYILCKTLSPC